MKPLIPKRCILPPTDFTYVDYVHSSITGYTRDDEGYAVCLDEPALSWMCESEVEAYRAAIRQIDLVRDELLAKLENINGEIYRDD